MDIISRIWVWCRVREYCRLYQFRCVQRCKSGVILFGIQRVTLMHIRKAGVARTGGFGIDFPFWQSYQEPPLSTQAMSNGLRHQIERMRSGDFALSESNNRMVEIQS
jgi:hypothetical protein